MKFATGKSYPHPVLRDGSEDSDYPGYRFAISNRSDMVKVCGKGTGAKIVCEMEMTSEYLKRLIGEGKVSYGLLVKCSSTFFRIFLPSQTPAIEHVISQETLKDRVEISPFLVAKTNIDAFASQEMHVDWQHLAVDIQVGSVLGEEEPYIYWASDPDDKGISSIFDIATDTNLVDGEWSVGLEGDKVVISFNQKTRDSYTLAKEKAESEGTEEDLLASLFLPVLIDVMHIAKSEPDSYENCRWFSAINKRLEYLERQPLESNVADISSDAQAILEFPFRSSSILKGI